MSDDQDYHRITQRLNEVYSDDLDDAEKRECSRLAALHVFRRLDEDERASGSPSFLS